MAETLAPFTIARRCNDFLECTLGTACYRLAALLAKNHSDCEGKIIPPHRPKDIGNKAKDTGIKSPLKH